MRNGKKGLWNSQLAGFARPFAHSYPQLLWKTVIGTPMRIRSIFIAACATMRATPCGSIVMNYRHIYHAGNFADVLKHTVLVAATEALLIKPKPFFYLDTHAGLGRYNLQSQAAQKTREFLDGIARLRADSSNPPAIEKYLALIHAFNHGDTEVTQYPGSPLLMSAMMRAEDRAVVMELHPEDADTLRLNLGDDRRFGIHHGNGYDGLKAFLPPKERRGLVLIDPPYEQTEEFDQLTEALKTGYARWPQGIYMIWYPIKVRRDIERFHRRLQATGLRKIMVIEQLIYTDEVATRLNGSGLIIVNPPYQLEQRLSPTLAWLTPKLAQQGIGSWRIDWLVPE